MVTVIQMKEDGKEKEDMVEGRRRRREKGSGKECKWRRK